MGCSQGKTTTPSQMPMASVAPPTPSTSAKPAPTLLSPTSAQKQKIMAEEGVGASVNDTEGKADELQADSKESVAALQALESVANGAPEALESAAALQADSKDWPLRWRALRVFAMADKGADGLLDAKELAGDGSNAVLTKMLHDVLDGNVPLWLHVTQAEWLESVKKSVLKDEVQAALFLDLCDVRLRERKEHWPLRDEALQVFLMGDRDHNGQLDMSELAEIRQSAEFAQAMIGNVDIDKNGTVSKGEWLAYVKRLADHDEKSAAAVLAMYKEHLSNSSNTAEAYVAAKAAIDVLVEDSGVRATERWWACC